jgi:hypothetical protein
MIEKIFWFILFVAAIVTAAVFFTVQHDTVGAGVLVLFALAFLNARAQSPFLKFS